MGNCIFCQIRDGDSPASIVYRDDRVMAFMDISPINAGHVLVIPLEHYVFLADVPLEVVGHLFVVTHQLTAAVYQSGVKCEGINLFLADGEAAFQEIFHVHAHIIPRFKGDSFKIEADWSNRPLRDELDKMAARIREYINE